MSDTWKVKLTQIIVNFFKSQYFWRFFALICVVCMFLFLIFTDNSCNFKDKTIESKSKVTEVKKND